MIGVFIIRLISSEEYNSLILSVNSRGGRSSQVLEKIWRTLSDLPRRRIGTSENSRERQESRYSGAPRNVTETKKEEVLKTVDFEMAKWRKRLSVSAHRKPQNLRDCGSEDPRDM